MGIKNGTIMIGHIAGDPRLTHSEKTGTPRFYARVGVDHWRREDDGTFTKTDRTFHDLAVRYKAAEAAMELFKKGDEFIATGRVEKFTDAGAPFIPWIISGHSVEDLLEALDAPLPAHADRALIHGAVRSLDRRPAPKEEE